MEVSRTTRYSRMLMMIVAFALFLTPRSYAQEKNHLVLDKKHLILDINDVFFKASRWQIAKKIINWPIVKYLLWYRKHPKKVLFDFLEQEFGEQTAINGDYIMGDGSKLPKIMCDNKRGIETSESLIKKAMERIASPQKFKFCSESEKEVVKAMITTVFDPDTIASHTYPIDEAVHLFKEYADKGVQIMVLSNFPKDTFEAFYAKPSTQEVFNKLGIKKEHIFISGEIGAAKPEAEIYQALKRYLIKSKPAFEDPNYLARHCLFIDDKESNIKGARRQGFSGQVCDSDYLALRKKINYHFYLTAPSDSGLYNK